MQGRWTIYPCPACGLATGRHKDCDVERPETPVVPCDDAAIERMAIRRAGGLTVWAYLPLSRQDALLEDARDDLRAAGETP